VKNFRGPLFLSHPVEKLVLLSDFVDVMQELLANMWWLENVCQSVAVTIDQSVGCFTFWLRLSLCHFAEVKFNRSTYLKIKGLKVVL